MSKWRLVDSVDGVNTYHWYDHDAKKTHIRTENTNTSALLDYATKQRNAASDNWKGDMHHVASIPVEVWEQWWKEFGGNPGAKENWPKLAAKLNSKDWCKLRTKEGRV